LRSYLIAVHTATSATTYKVVYLRILNRLSKVGSIMMFLPEDKWSPRYEAQFYTIRMKRFKTINNSSELPYSDFDTEDTCSIFGIKCNNKKLPAIYYQIEVLCGTKQYTILRRYSQFVQLCKKLDPNNTMKIKNSLPPKSPLLMFHNPTKLDYYKRMESLYTFMNDLLTRQEFVDNILIMQFLELNDK